MVEELHSPIVLKGAELDVFVQDRAFLHAVQRRTISPVAR